MKRRCLNLAISANRDSARRLDARVESDACQRVKRSALIEPAVVRAAFEQSDASIAMTQPFYVAVPYTMAELSEVEEQHENGEYIDCVGYDVQGFCGEIRLDDEWPTV